MEIKLSIHQIKRLCKLLGLNRKRNYAPIERAEAAVKVHISSLSKKFLITTVLSLILL